MPPSPPQIVSLELAESLLAQASAPQDWNLTAERFQTALESSAAHRFLSAGRAESPGERRVQEYLEGLHLADLALACACSAGNCAAWEHFVAEYRHVLYRAAAAIAGESRARELADLIYAELYGLREREGERRSLFDYFHGRSRLATWLYAILSRRHVDEFRRTQKMESFDDPPREGAAEPVSAEPAPDPEREVYLAMMQAAVETALDRLEPRDRLRLAYYYADSLTLAEIGKLLGEHEATASRKLERTRAEVRAFVEQALRREKKLSEAQVRLCFDCAQEKWPFDLTIRLRSGRPRGLPARE
jgi:RNA polymerase sigma-70 factor, ECF subfamily